MGSPTREAEQVLPHGGVLRERLVDGRSQW